MRGRGRTHTPGHRDRPVNRYPLSPKYVEITYSTYSERDAIVQRHGGMAPVVRKPFSSAAAGLFLFKRWRKKLARALSRHRR